MSDEYVIEMRQAFVDGVAYAMGQVEPERDWERSTASKFVQKTDSATELKVWSLVVADPGAATQRRVKLLCDDEPVIPEPTGGMPFVPVEFVALSMRPWLDDRGCKFRPGKRCGCRVELSLRARGVRGVNVPAAARPAPAGMPGTSDAA